MLTVVTRAETIHRHTGIPRIRGYRYVSQYAEANNGTIRYICNIYQSWKGTQNTHKQPVYSDNTSKFSPNTLHLENSEEAAIVVTTSHHYCAASSGHEECNAPDRRPSSQASASQLRAAKYWNVSRNVSYRVHCIVYRGLGVSFQP